MKAGVLFVCTGNTCRSSMAEALAKKWLQTEGNGAKIELASAGLAAWPGSPASSGAMVVMREMDIDLGNHKAQRITKELVAKASLVLTMTSGHKNALIQQFPENKEKIFTLGEYANFKQDIADPYGQEVDVYRQCAGELQLLLERALKNFLSC